MPFSKVRQHFYQFITMKSLKEEGMHISYRLCITNKSDKGYRFIGP